MIAVRHWPLQLVLHRYAVILQRAAREHFRWEALLYKVSAPYLAKGARKAEPPEPPTILDWMLE